MTNKLLTAFTLVVIFICLPGIIYSDSSKLTGFDWNALDIGVNDIVEDLAVYQDELIVGGNFTTAGGSPSFCIAKWDGTNWSDLNSGTNGSVLALAVYKGKLIAGGFFTVAGSASVDNIAAWDGVSWSALGGGLDDIVLDLAVFNNELYVSGLFTSADGIPTNHIARWNGSNWSTVGSSAGFNGWPYCLTTNGEELIAGGNFTTADGNPANRIARWDGASWSAIGSGFNSTVRALDYHKGDLIAGGSFTSSGSTSLYYIARWNGLTWKEMYLGMNDIVYALSSYGGELFAGGIFTIAGGLYANNIVRWDGLSWKDLGSGTSDKVNAIFNYDDKLIVGGEFAFAGGTLVAAIASWSNSPNTFGCFIRGDVNSDAHVDYQDLDALYYSTLFGYDLISCYQSADVNDDGLVTISDYILLIGHLTSGLFIPGSFPHCECEYGAESCIFNCDQDFITSFPNYGGTWTIGSQQVVTWSNLKFDQDDYESIDIELQGSGSPVIIANGILYGKYSTTITVPSVSEGFYQVKVIANLYNGTKQIDYGNKGIYIPSNNDPIGVVNTVFHDYQFKTPLNCQPPLSFTGIDYSTDYKEGRADVDMTVTATGKYMLMPRLLDPYPPHNLAPRLELMDLTQPGCPVEIILNPAPIFRGIDPVAIPYSDKMLYTVDYECRLYDFSQSPPLVNEVTAFVYDRIDVDPVVSNDGQKAIRPSSNGYDVIDLRSTIMSLVHLGSSISTYYGVDAVITPDNNMALYLAPGGYHMIDITDPSTPLIAGTIPGDPISHSGKCADIDIGLSNCGNRFIYPSTSPLGYDVVDMCDKNNPVTTHINSDPIIKTAIDPTLTHDGRYALYPSMSGLNRGYDRIDMRYGYKIFIPGDPYPYDGFDIVITPNDRYALFPARKEIVMKSSIMLIFEGYDLIDIEGAQILKFITGKPALQAHNDIQITPDGNIAIYPLGVAQIVNGYDIIELDNPGQFTAQAVNFAGQNFRLITSRDNDIVISPNGDYAVHCGSAPSSSGQPDGTSLVCIDLEKPYEAVSPADFYLRRSSSLDPIINLTATTAEDVDQDHYIVFADVVHPIPTELDDDNPPHITIPIIDTTDLGPTWTPEPGHDPDSAWPLIRFLFGNESEDACGFSFKANFVQYSGDSAFWYSVPESFSVSLPAEDSITIECKPNLPEDMPMGLTYLMIEWFEGYETVGIANNRFAAPFLLYKCGDANSDASVNVSDAVYIINFVFSGGTAPNPIESGDTNCDGSCNVSDAVYIINYVFSSGNTPCDTNGDDIPDC